MNHFSTFIIIYSTEWAKIYFFRITIKYLLEIQIVLPCSAVVPGAEVVGTGVGEVEAATAVASVTVDEQGEIEVVCV